MSDEPPKTIDLPRSEYRVPRYGRVHTWQMLFTALVGVGGMTYSFVHRFEVEPTTLFFATAIMGALTGGALMILFRKFI